jgi:uncharacterized protein VirK/YbjX
MLLSERSVFSNRALTHTATKMLQLRCFCSARFRRICRVAVLRDHLQNLVFCKKARSASIFVAVCVSAR